MCVDDDNCFNQVLVIPLEANLSMGAECSFQIFYNTSLATFLGAPEPYVAYAANWVPANETAGGMLPALYTYCMTNSCRSIAPLMDTPSI